MRVGLAPFFWEGAFRGRIHGNICAPLISTQRASTPLSLLCSPPARQGVCPSTCAGMSAHSLRLPALLALAAVYFVSVALCSAQDAAVDAAAASASGEEVEVTAANYDPRRVEWSAVVEACKSIGRKLKNAWDWRRCALAFAHTQPHAAAVAPPAARSRRR